MIKILKIIIKKILNYFGWSLSKRYVNKSYTNQKPNFNLLEALYLSKGVLHMGAHRGGEAPVYDWLHKKTLWIEANPKIFLDLENYVTTFINQTAYNILLYQEDNIEKTFKISNNDAASSSIYEFGNSNFDNNVNMVDRITLKTMKLDTFFKKEKITATEFDFWVLDLQGAELPTLKGAIKSLKYCKYIYVEISKNDYYKNGTKWSELKQFLIKNNFQNLWEPESDHTDILFINKSI
jgi:FkbM family methyltransferase